jgi:4a-hydroxytetrahydrobiopterin dehydratase
MSWTKKNGYLIKKFEFSSYESGLKFVNEIARIANEVDHHPDIILKYNRVIVRTTTHDEGNTISDKDYNLTSLIDNLIEKDGKGA